jgi:hypothetical protein
LVEDGGEGFIEDRLQDEGAISVKSIIFFAVYPLVILKAIRWKNNLHFRCGGLKPF